MAKPKKDAIISASDILSSVGFNGTARRLPPDSTQAEMGLPSYPTRTPKPTETPGGFTDPIAQRLTADVQSGTNFLVAGTGSMFAGGLHAMAAFGGQAIENLGASLGVPGFYSRPAGQVLVETFRETSDWAYQKLSVGGSELQIAREQAVIDPLMKGLETARETAGGAVLDATGSPELAAIAHTAPDALLFAIGGRTVHGGKAGEALPHMSYLEYAKRRRELARIQEAGEGIQPVDLDAIPTPKAAKEAIQLEKTLEAVRKDLEKLEASIRSPKVQANRNLLDDIIYKHIKLKEQEATFIKDLNELKAVEGVEFQFGYLKEKAKQYSEHFGTTVAWEFRQLFDEHARTYPLDNPTVIATALDVPLPKVGEHLRSGALDIPANQLIDRLVKYIKEGENAKGEPIEATVPLQKDIGPIQSDVSLQLQPAKFAARHNDLLHWVSTVLSKKRIGEERMIDTLLNAPEFVKEKATGWARVKFGGVKYKAGKESLNVMWDNLHNKEQVNTWKALIELDKNPLEKVTDTALAETYGLSPKEITVFRKFHDVSSELLKLYNDAVKEAKPDTYKPIERVPLWVPHMFLGDFRVFARDAKGKKVIAMPAHTRAGAALLEKQFKQKYPDYTFEIKAAEKKGSSDVSLSSFIEALDYLAEGTPEHKIMKDTFESIQRNRGFGVHRRRRQGVRGFTGDVEGGLLHVGPKAFMKSYTSYIEGGVKAIYNMVTDARLNEVLSEGNVIKHYPNSVNYIEGLRANSFGARGFVSAKVEKWTRDWLGASKLDSFVGFANKVTLFMKLPSPKFFAAQALQPFLVNPAALLSLKTNGIRASMMKAMAKGTVEWAFPNQESINVLKEAVRMRTIEPKFLEEIVESMRPSRAMKKHGKVMGTAKIAADYVNPVKGLMSMMSEMELRSRAMSVLQFYYYLKDANPGRTKSALAKDAAYLTDKYMVEYNSIERPLMLSTYKTGIIGKSYGLFKTFTANYLTQMVDHLETWKRQGIFNPEAAAPFATYLATQVFMAGVHGMIAIQIADALIETMNDIGGWEIPTITDFFYEKGTPEYLMVGAPSYALNMDLTTTMAAPSLAPADMFTMPGLEHIGKISAYSSAYIWKKFNGEATISDEMLWWKQSVPKILEGTVEAYYTKKLHGSIVGQPVPDPKQKMRGRVKRDLQDWWIRLLSGTTSTREAIELRRYYNQMRIEKRMTDKTEAAINVISLSLATGEELPDWAFEYLATEALMSGKQINQAIQARILLWNSTLLERKITQGQRNKAKMLSMEEQGLFEQQGRSPQAPSSPSSDVWDIPTQ